VSASESVTKRIGTRIACARRAAGMTQQQLSERLDIARSSIANLERGHQDMPISRIAVIAEILSLDLADLVRAGDLPPAPHDVRIRRVYEVTCETCGGTVIDCPADRAVALESKRDHIAYWRADEARRVIARAAGDLRDDRNDHEGG